MSTNSPSVKSKGAKKKAGEAPVNGGAAVAKTKDAIARTVQSEWDYKLALVIITIIAFVTRFYYITYPKEVVFDEVHFGKFASHYLQREYFFDVHPPFGKLLFALAGWFVGYDGAFHFDNIGDSYITNHVPYVAYRAVPALQGAITVPVVFLIMWESGYSLPACILSAGMILFDNGHIAETRLILLDATLILFMALSILCYIRFYKLRHDPFGRKWWKWLLLTGVCLSCVISTKYIGIFTFFSIGVPVLIDLWALMDIKRPQGALSMQQFIQHFAARAGALIVFPFIIYLFWFQVHFAILTRSGTGDDFMSPEFQETLSDNLMTAHAVGIDYYDSISMMHKETGVFLHSHLDRYPLRYDDGRVSSQGQQVTGYPHNDTNNFWQIIPTKRGLSGSGHRVLAGDIVKLRHIVTDSYLLSHDVASPYYPTNQEFTTTPPEDAMGDRHNDTLFEIRVDGARPGQEFKTKATYFKLMHVPSRVAMWTHTTPLPEWGYKQAEINGNKNLGLTANLWFADEIAGLPADSPRRNYEKKAPKVLPFFTKWLELQRLMFYHNSILTGSHPYASFPISWPFLLRGVSYWTNHNDREQIYFVGNPLAWWIASSLLAVFAGIIGADQLSQRRGVDALDPRTRSRLYNSTGFFFLTWAAHYVPFFLMGRQLFLHHYLPAHLLSCLVTGALLEFVFNIEPAQPQHSVTDAFTSNSAALTTDGPSKGVVSTPGRRRAGTNSTHKPVRERIGSQNLSVSWAAAAVILAVVIYGYVFFAPLTYGTPGLDVEEVVKRKWMGYDLHFAK